MHRLKYVMLDPTSGVYSLHCPDYVEPAQDEAELELVGRIFRSFKLMKEKQLDAADHYQPSALWQAHIDHDYAPLTSSVERDDIQEFHFFLANFGTWKEFLGVESNVLIRQNMKSMIGRLYLRNDVFHRPFNIWQWFYNSRKPISCLSYPTHGNQPGCYVGEVFIGAGSYFNEIYGSMLSGLMDDIPRPVVAELGAGYGKLAYFTLRDREEFAFVDFDLPETLCLAAYYLMKVWPQKNALLFGEDEYSAEAHPKYDLIFMPSFEIENVGRDTVDLFINKNSLGEMPHKAMANFASHIACASDYFFHMNIENNPNMYSDGTVGPMASQYPVPMDSFRLLFRYPDLDHLLSQGFLDLRQDIFIYLYQRKNVALRDEHKLDAQAGGRR